MKRLNDTETPIFILLCVLCFQGQPFKDCIIMILHHCRTGIDALYTVSYLWYPSIGMATAVIVGLIVSSITGILHLSFKKNRPSRYTTLKRRHFNVDSTCHAGWCYILSKFYIHSENGSTLKGKNLESTMIMVARKLQAYMLVWIFTSSNIYHSTLFPKYLRNNLDSTSTNSYLTPRTTKPTIRLVRSEKTQISLRIRAVWSESSLIVCAVYSQRGINREVLPYWMDVQADRSLCWSYKSYCRFVVRLLICNFEQQVRPHQWSLYHFSTIFKTSWNARNDHKEPENKLYTTMKIQTQLQSKYKLHYNQNTNYATMKIQTILQWKYKLRYSQNTNYTPIKVQTTLQWKYKICYNKKQTTLQSKYKLHYNENTKYATIKIQTTLQWKYKIRYNKKQTTLRSKYKLHYNENTKYATERIQTTLQWSTGMCFRPSRNTNTSCYEDN